MGDVQKPLVFKMKPKVKKKGNSAVDNLKLHSGHRASWPQRPPTPDYNTIYQTESSTNQLRGRSQNSYQQPANFANPSKQPSKYEKEKLNWNYYSVDKKNNNSFQYLDQGQATLPYSLPQPQIPPPPEYTTNPHLSLYTSQQNDSTTSLPEYSADIANCFSQHNLCYQQQNVYQLPSTYFDWSQKPSSMVPQYDNPSFQQVNDQTSISNSPQKQWNEEYKMPLPHTSPSMTYKHCPCGSQSQYGEQYPLNFSGNNLKSQNSINLSEYNWSPYTRPSSVSSIVNEGFSWNVQHPAGENYTTYRQSDQNMFLNHVPPTQPPILQDHRVNMFQPVVPSNEGLQQTCPSNGDHYIPLPQPLQLVKPKSVPSMLNLDKQKPPLLEDYSTCVFYPKNSEILQVDSSYNWMKQEPGLVSPVARPPFVSPGQHHSTYTSLSEPATTCTEVSPIQENFVQSCNMLPDPQTQTGE